MLVAASQIIDLHFEVVNTFCYRSFLVITLFDFGPVECLVLRVGFFRVLAECDEFRVEGKSLRLGVDFALEREVVLLETA